MALKEVEPGTYYRVVVIRDEAFGYFALQVSKCEELINNANAGIGKAPEESQLK